MRRLAALLLLLALPAAADEAPFSKLRFEDPLPQDPSAGLGRLKRIPLPLAETHLSVGGEARLRYDYRGNPEWGQAPEDESGAFLQRYLLHGNLELGRHVRVFGELRSALENGRTAGPSPVEVGELDLQQAFLELRGSLGGGSLSVSARMGRQEMFFGSERLVAVREGPNVRRRFDGVRLDVGGEGFSATALAAYLTENEPGFFSDGSQEEVAIWGLYGVLEAPLGLPTDVDLYYLGFRDRDAAFLQGAARERRHSVGTRLHGRRGDLDWNWEGVVQWGRFGDGRILAWTFASETGYRLARLPFSPRLVLSANLASGDDDPADPDLQTFNPLFPRGNYFSHLALLGPRNFANLHPGIELALGETLALAFDANFYWRLQRSDGLYGPAGNLLRAGTGSERRYVGPALSASLDWTPNRYASVGLIYTHGFPGPFVRDTGPSDDIDFVELTLRFRF